MKVGSHPGLCTARISRRVLASTSRLPWIRVLQSTQRRSFTPRRSTRTFDRPPQPTDDVMQVLEQPLRRDQIEAMQAHELAREQDFVLQQAPTALPVDFQPERLTARSLITNRIATASHTASHAAVQHALARLSRRDDTSYAFDARMAREVAQGKKLVRFRDADEKARILALAEEHATETARKRNFRRMKQAENSDKQVEYEAPLPVVFQPVPDKHRREIVDKVLRGKYNVWREANSLLKSRLHANGTFTPRGLDGFLSIFRRFLPSKNSSK